MLISVNHASLVIIFVKEAFNELKFNPIIVTYLLLRRDRIIASKKSADFTNFWTFIRCVQCLMHCMSSVNEIDTLLLRYVHWH